MKTTAADLVLNELLWCGGEQITRAQLQREMLDEGLAPRDIDFYLFWLGSHQGKEKQQAQEAKHNE